MPNVDRVSSVTVTGRHGRKFAIKLLKAPKRGMSSHAVDLAVVVSMQKVLHG